MVVTSAGDDTASLIDTDTNRLGTDQHSPR
jgi:hypothetical protein